MTNLPEHVVANRTAWTELSKNFEEPGRRAWESNEIRWGCCDVAEEVVKALPDVNGLDVIELGCGTGYFSVWLARRGARCTGIDITPAQLDNARKFQAEFDVHFPLIEGSAEATGLPDASFDLALSEYGASIWCDPYVWIPEAARLLRPGGRLVFLANTAISVMCVPELMGQESEGLLRSAAEIRRIEWQDDGSVEFHLLPGEWFSLLSANGFRVEKLVELYPSETASESSFPYLSIDWARKWPSEEVWVATKVA